MKDPKPPKAALRFFRWYCREDRLEELEGDLEETFVRDMASGTSLFIAGLRYWWIVICCFRTYAIGRKRNRRLSMGAIAQNNFKVVIRNFRKNRFYGWLNIFGMTLSFAAFLLIMIYLKYETGFENFHEKVARIYRVTYQMDNGNGFRSHWARVAEDFINNLPEEVAGIDRLIRFQNHEQKYIKIGARKFKEDHVYVTDKDVFEVFSFELTTGDPGNALAEPNSVVLTEALAKKYFGDKNAYGKSIEILGDWSPEPGTYKITGIMKDLPKQTHLPGDMLISFQNEAERTWWAYIYVLLNPGVDPGDVQADIARFADEHTTDYTLEVDFSLQSIKSIPLHSDLAREIIPNGSIQNVRIFILIGFLILVTGLINFTNLNSVMSVTRSKEMGVRKVLGAESGVLAFASIMESIMYSLAAMFLGGTIVYLIFPCFQDFTEVSFLISSVTLGAGMLIIALLSGLLDGIRPSVIAVCYQAFNLIRNMTIDPGNRRGFYFKKGSLAFQFFIAILLLSAAFVASDQFRFMNSQNLQMNPEEIVAMPRVPDGITGQFHHFNPHYSSGKNIGGL